MKEKHKEILEIYNLQSIKNNPILLKKYHLTTNDVCDYHMYPIADNDTPKLSADRLEYSLSNALFTYSVLDIESIKEIYEDIEIQTNGKNEIELGFKTKKIARNFVKFTSKLSVISSLRQVRGYTHPQAWVQPIQNP